MSGNVLNILKFIETDTLNLFLSSFKIIGKTKTRNILIKINERLVFETKIN